MAVLGLPALLAACGPTVPAHRAAATCPTSSVVATFGPGGVAAGTSYRQIEFRNRGHASCILRGYPTISFLDSSGQQIGFAATHPSTPTSAITVARNGHAYASVAIPSPYNFPAALCEMRAATSLRILLPENSVPLVLSDHVEICSTPAGRTSVTSFRAGASSTPAGS